MIKFPEKSKRLTSKGWFTVFLKSLRSVASRDFLVCLGFLGLGLIIYFLPTGFENRVASRVERVRAKVLSVDNSFVYERGLVRSGDQEVNLKILDGKFVGEVVCANNPLLGQLDRDKLFCKGDKVLTVLSLSPEGKIVYANPQEHYRISVETVLALLFAGLLIIFGGWTGLKALISFAFAGLCIIKILVPLLLLGFDPIWASLGVVALLTAAIIFLVAGASTKGLVAFLGAFLGVLVSAILSKMFTELFHIHGAILPFAETLLYSGYAHLDLTGIFIAGVFLAASGAVMDLAMDVAASMQELVDKRPDMTTRELCFSGIRIGRAVVGTMTTTLLLAYSGGYLTLLMAFMAQGVPMTNTLNLIYVAAEILKTIVGSFGLVLVAPFTAIIGAVLFGRKGFDLDNCETLPSSKKTASES